MVDSETGTGIPQHEKAPRRDGEYSAQWRAFALRRGLALFLLFSWLPVSTASFEISRRGVHQPLLFGGLILLWLGLALAAVWWAGEFRCPRCRRRYAALGDSKGDANLMRGLFDKVCSNCRLSKFERFEKN